MDYTQAKHLFQLILGDAQPVWCQMAKTRDDWQFPHFDVMDDIVLEWKWQVIIVDQ